MNHREESQRWLDLANELCNFQVSCTRGEQAWHNAYQLPWSAIDRALIRLSEIYRLRAINEENEA